MEQKFIPSKTDKIFYVMSVFTFFLSFILIFYVGYLMFVPIKIFEKLSPIYIRHNGPIKAGDDIQYEYKYCKYLDYKGLVNIVFIDGNSVLPQYVTPTQKGVGCGTIKRDLAIPLKAKAGWYKLHLTVIYEINELRQITMEWDSEPFLIVSK